MYVTKLDLVRSTVGLSMVAAIAGILSALAGPAAPIVVPIAAGFVLTKWVYEVYQSSYVLLLKYPERKY